MGLQRQRFDGDTPYGAQVMASEARAIPVALDVFTANTAENTVAEPVLAQLRVPRLGAGRPKTRLHVVAVDKAFDSTELRRALHRRGMRASAPEHVWKSRQRRKRGRPPVLHSDSKKRYQVERVHGWFDNWRALVVRYECKVANYRGLCVFAAILICLRVLLTW